MDHKKALEIQLTTVEQVIGARLDVQQVQGVDLLSIAVAAVNECGDEAAQIRWCVQFD